MEAGHLSKHERLLQSEDPVLNFQRREEALVQRRLDHGTQRISKDLQQRNELTRRETQRINKTIEDRFYQLIANTPGLEVRNPATERREIDPKQQHNNTNTAALSRSKQQQSHTAAPQPQGPTTSRSTHTRTNKTTTSNNNTAPAAIAVGPDACPTSNYSVCFPTPFDQSGFSSVLSWADVSYQEATVSALGPRADVAKIRQTELPNRLLVSIACYLMNEVLSRDSSMCELWKILRVPIFDAVFSPRLIATEMRRRVDEESGAVPRPEVGEVQPLPHRQARYDNLHDFASYRLWTEEFLSARRENEALAHRIHELKGVVLKSRLVLQMAQRRVDQARKQIFFNAWRTYTRRTKAFREAAMKYLTHNKRRALEESSFLRWRRMTLQTKIDVMQEQLLELNHRLRQESKASGAIISALRTKIEEEERIKEGLLLKDEALRSQMMESHLMESRALRLVLSKKHQHFLSMKAHARRWERLAKTYRPLMLCPAVPPSAMAAGLALRRLEEEVASGKCTAGYRSTPIRHNIEMILMRWTNLIMSTATLPGGRKWRKVGMIDRRATGGGSGNAFTLYTLLDVVRELRRSYAEELSSDILQQINAWVAEQDQRNRLTSSSSSAASSEDFLKPREGADAMLTYMLHQSGAEAGEAPPHPLASLFHEVCVVLYLQTSEGLYPSLITHCAVLPTFFHAAGFMKLSHLNLLWVLSALFTGWVHRRCGAESMLPSVAPEYLRCREEARLAQRPNPAITTAVRELQSVDHHQQQQQHALTSPTNGGGLGAYVVSSNTKIGKYAPTTASSMGDARMSVATTAHTGLSTPSIAKITCQCSKLEDLSLVRAGADTAADVEVYVGIKNEEVFWSEDEDVDDVLADVVDAEQRELVRRRRARAGQLELHEQENRGRTTKCPPEPPHFRDEASMSDVEELLHAQEDSMDDVEASLTAEDLQELRSGAAHIEDLLAAHKKKQDEDAIYTLSSVKQSILTPPQIQLIANLPPPTLAFDVPRPKGRAVAKKALKKRANTTTAYTNANNNNNNNNNVRGRRGRARGYRGSDEDEDEEEAYLAYATDADVWRRRTRRIAVHTFLTLTQADSERRRQWLGLARIITSLATRFRALDSAATLAAAAEAAGAAPPPPPAGGGGGGGGASRRSTKGRRTASASPNVSAAGGAGPTTTTASATPALGRTSANSSRAATTAEPTLAASPSPLHLEGRFGTGGGATASARRAAATHNTTTTTTTTNTNTNTTTMNVASSLSGRNASAHHDSSRVVEVEDPEDEHLRSSSGGGGGGAGVASSHAATHRHAKALRHHHALPPIDLPPTHGDGGTERSASTQRSNRGAPPPLLSLASPPPEQPTEEILMMDGAAPTTSSSTHIEPLPPQPGNTATVSFGATAPTTTTTAALGAPPPQRKRRESDTAVVAPDRRDLLRQFQQRFAEAPPSDADHSQQQQQQQQQHRMEVLSSGRRSPPPVNAPVVVPTPQPVSSDDRIVAMENFANIRRSPRAAATRLLSPHGRIEMPSDGPLEPLYIHTEPLVAPPRPRDRFGFDERSKR